MVYNKNKACMAHVFPTCTMQTIEWNYIEENTYNFGSPLFRMVQRFLDFILIGSYNRFVSNIKTEHPISVCSASVLHFYMCVKPI